MESPSLEKQITTKLSGQCRGKVLFPEDFAEMGSEEAVRQALHRLEKNDFLARLAHGIYWYPRRDEVLGVMYPSLDEVAAAIARRDKSRIIPTGVQALNRLGLSTQIPMKVVYLTDGAAREIKVGRNIIKFKRTTPRNLAAKGDISGLVIQALRAIGKDQARPEELKKIHGLLQQEEVDKLLHDARLAPAWIRKIMLDAIKQKA